MSRELARKIRDAYIAVGIEGSLATVQMGEEVILDTTMALNPFESDLEDVFFIRIIRLPKGKNKKIYKDLQTD